MDGNLVDSESLLFRIQQLENERDELHKDIEQLCMQQAGPSYLAVATKMHFQRTAGLEQEIENLKKKLAACSRENLNLQEELSEVYRIKSQLADLHSAESAKNVEAEKQVKFFQSCVAAAFAERDNAIMEAEKAKEKEELMAQRFYELQKKVEELLEDCSEQKKSSHKLQTDLAKQEEQNQAFKKVVNKFYEIKQHSLHTFEDTSWDDKCACLLCDPVEVWSFNDTSTAKYISALEEELESMRNSLDNLQNKFMVSLEIEKHLKRRVRELEKKIILAVEIMKDGVAGLRHYHSQHRVHILNLLDDGKSQIKSVANMIGEKIGPFGESRGQYLGPSLREVIQEEKECGDLQLSTDVRHDLPSQEVSLSFTDSMAIGKSDTSEAPAQALQEKEVSLSSSDSVAVGMGDTSEALAQALQEKVAALLLLSQQEERYLLDRNLNVALQRKVEDLQRNLLQVTNEKVRALMELAQVKQEHQELKEKVSKNINDERLPIDVEDKRLITPEREGRLKNLLRKTNLTRWVGSLDFRLNESEFQAKDDGSSRRSNNMDIARLKIENATLKESLESVEHLATSVHRLRLNLLKAKQSVTSEGTNTITLESLAEIINEAILVKTALRSSLPISWSADTDTGSHGESISNEPDNVHGSGNEKMDYVSAAGFEMVELLIIAAQLLKDCSSKSAS